jgi:hypothetical protein
MVGVLKGALEALAASDFVTVASAHAANGTMTTVPQDWTAQVDALMLRTRDPQGSGGDAAAAGDGAH